MYVLFVVDIPLKNATAIAPHRSIAIMVATNIHMSGHMHMSRTGLIVIVRFVPPMRVNTTIDSNRINTLTGNTSDASVTTITKTW